MGSKYWQLMEVSRLVKDDPLANLLLEAFLDACFDCVQPPDWAPVIPREHHTRAQAERIAAALEALNAHLRRRALLPNGIVPPADVELDEWAEEIAMQLLTNSPC